MTCREAYLPVYPCSSVLGTVAGVNSHSLDAERLQLCLYPPNLDIDINTFKKPYNTKPQRSSPEGVKSCTLFTGSRSILGLTMVRVRVRVICLFPF